MGCTRVAHDIPASMACKQSVDVRRALPIRALRRRILHMSALQRSATVGTPRSQPMLGAASELSTSHYRFKNTIINRNCKTNTQFYKGTLR